MKKMFSLFILLFSPFSFHSIAQSADMSGAGSFSDWFQNKTLRVDYVLTGDATTETACFVQMKEEPLYGGPSKITPDSFGYGSYRYQEYDSASNKLLYSKGFNSLFQEWKGTPEAKLMKRAYPMTAVMPFPKKTVLFRVQKRAFSTDEFEDIFQRYINPGDYFIKHEPVTPVKFSKFKDNGDPANHVDIAFVAEGYTSAQMDKFLRDANRIANYFLQVEPYKEMADKFNFYAIEASSVDSGVTIPGQHIWKNTNCSSSFYTFNMDRYLTTPETHTIYNIAANVPYDVIFILVNSKRYGGGGFYNHYGQSTVDHPLSEKVAIHEFGHEFAGLADEYYQSEITYSDFYNLKFEPWEPNITTNVNFSSKWQSMISKEIPIPTPRTSNYKESVGMFEGGGYLAKGIYSPAMDCRMKSNEAAGFCPVCREAIIKMIRYYTE